jgi:hypothetical protein
VGCDLANATICPALEAGVPTVVLLYNSQAQGRTAVPVRLPVGFPAGVKSYAVYGPTGAAVTAQLLPLNAEDGVLRTEYYAYKSGVSVQWLAFQAALPAVGFAAYFVVPSATSAGAPSTFESTVAEVVLSDSAAPVTLSNGVLTLTFDGASGLLTTWANTQS